MDVFPREMDAYARSLDLPPRKRRGWVHEIEVPLGAGESLAYESRYEGPAGRVEFNVHSHHGRDVTYHLKGTDATMAGTFIAPEAGKFYLMWENLSDGPIRIHVRATRRSG